MGFSFFSSSKPAAATTAALSSEDGAVPPPDVVSVSAASTSSNTEAAPKQRGAHSHASPEEEKDCFMCKVVKEGWCTKQFNAMDACFDAAKAAGRDEDTECMPLFDAFRECFAKKMQFTEFVKGAIKH